MEHIYCTVCSAVGVVQKATEEKETKKEERRVSCILVVNRVAVSCINVSPNTTQVKL